MDKICYCTGTKEGIKDCTFSGDDCCGPVTDEDDKIMKSILEAVPKKLKYRVREAMLDFRMTPVALLKKTLNER